MFFRDKRDESHRRKVKHHFHEGRLYGTTLEILYVHDLTDMINFRDATYLYDVEDHKTNMTYYGLTYKEVVRLIKHQPVNRKIVFFLTQDMVDKLRYGYCVEDDRELDILSNRRKVPSKMELHLVDFANPI